MNRYTDGERDKETMDDGDGVVELNEQSLETHEKLTKIMDYYDRGYLFHGSPKGDITTFHPRQSSDVGRDETHFNVDEAVFASDMPESTIAFSLFRNRDVIPKENRSGKYSVTWDKGKAVVRAAAKWKPYIDKCFLLGINSQRLSLMAYR